MIRADDGPVIVRPAGPPTPGYAIPPPPEEEPEEPTTDREESTP